MVNDNILLITEDEEVTEKILSKLLLLRESDTIAVCDYKTSKKILAHSPVSVVILHKKEDNEKTLKFIETIKSTNYEIILLMNNNDADFILQAYDAGISDYFTTNSAPYEMLIKTVNCFKKLSLKTALLRNEIVLNEFDAIENETGFYRYKACKNSLIELIKNPKIKNGMFIMLTAGEKSKNRFTADKLSKAIQSAVRYDDIVYTLRGGKFYIILPNNDKAGALAVVHKIQNILTNKLIIRAGIAKIGDKSFDKIEKEINSALSDAVQSNETAVYLEDKINNDWLDLYENNDKKFKLFQNAYLNKLEKVITPTFFRLQKTYEEKLSDTKIEQYTNELQSAFFLKHKKQESCLKINYPGYTKIIVSIVHEGLDSPENTHIEINLNEVTQKSVTKLIEDFVKEFKSCLKG